MSDAQMTHQPQGKAVTEKQREFGRKKERGKWGDRLKEGKGGGRALCVQQFVLMLR